MAKYILKRLGLACIILFGVSVIIYGLMRMLPTSFVESKIFAMAGQTEISKEDIEKLFEAYGLNNSIIGGYFTWLRNFFTLDFGFSYKFDAPVIDIIKDTIWISFTIAMIATVLQLLIAIPLGIKAACKQYSLFDYSTTVFTLLGISLPSFFFSALAIKVFAVNLGWFDTSLGLVSANLPTDTTDFAYFVDKVWHLILPVSVIVILSLGGLMRYSRTNTLEVLNADYIRTARAKGLSEKTVVYKHAFKNTMIPIVTMIAGILPGLFGGSMIVEKIFKIPGIGLKAYEALVAGDIPFVMTYNMFIAVLTVIGVLLSDLLYVVVDPRVKIGK